MKLNKLRMSVLLCYDDHVSYAPMPMHLPITSNFVLDLILFRSCLFPNIYLHCYKWMNLSEQRRERKKLSVGIIECLLVFGTKENWGEWK